MKEPVRHFHSCGRLPTTVGLGVYLSMHNYFNYFIYRGVLLCVHDRVKNRTPSTGYMPSAYTIILYYQLKRLRYYNIMRIIQSVTGIPDE